ncbi:uncharacterized protein [Amphiura filiformis]|uniref:uncharacterized protein isoform X1 n=1 Tax=Amphiura filiformis TaxID=82378 RepID=UPI003B22017D
MNRRTRTLLPMSDKLLQPRVIDESKNMKQRIQKQAQNYNKSAKDLEPLQEGDVVRMKPLVQGQKNWQKAIVSRRLDERSYVVETPTAVYRRNRVHLKKTQETPPPVVSLPHQTPARNQETQQKETLKKQNQNNQDKTKNSKKPESSPKKGKTTRNNQQQPSPKKTSQQEPQPKTTRGNQQEPSPKRGNQQEPAPKEANQHQKPSPDQETRPVQRQELSTKSGRKIKCPSYLKDYV